jgi:hypothetical protein
VTQLWDLIWSLSSLAVFWIVGAACFQAIENWTFWNALYFEGKLKSVGQLAGIEAEVREFQSSSAWLSVTETFRPRRREDECSLWYTVLQLCHSLQASSFVSNANCIWGNLVNLARIETVTGLLSTYSNHRVTIRERKRTDIAKSEAFTAHRDFVLAHRASFDRMVESRAGKSLRRRETESTGEVPEGDTRSQLPERDARSDTDVRSEATFDEESALIEYVLDHALRLEAIARRLLIDSLPRDSMARTILLADREVQLRDVDALGGDTQKIIRLASEEDRLIGHEAVSDGKSPAATAHDNLDAIRRYRQTFAGLVAGGARLQKLEGDQRLIFERTRRVEHMSTVDTRQAEDESRVSPSQPKDEETAHRFDLPLGEALKQKMRLLRAVLHAEKDLSKTYSA